MAAAGRIGAALGILAVLVGTPSLLLLLGRALLPTSAPSGPDIIAALSRPDDGSLLAGVLLVAAVLVWAQLAVSIIAELVAVIRHRPGPRLELPGLGASRTLASVLVAGLLGAGTGTASAAPPPPIAVIATLNPVAVQTSQPADAPTYSVQPRDTLWRIAESQLGDPLRWREIYTLNAGIVQPDGGRLTEAALLHAGWVLVMPTSAGDDVVVRPGDTLSEIADRDLHDVRLTNELYAANKGRPQHDGMSLLDPDLIRPGWTLQLPMTAAARDDGTAETDPGQSAHAGPAPAEPSTIAPSRPTQPADPQPQKPAPALTPEPRTAAPADPTTPSREVPTAPSLVPTDAPSTVPTLLGVSSLVITGLLGALAVRRRRQLRHRFSRHRIAVPDDTSGRLEWTAAQTPPTLDDTVLDAALRGLTLHDWSATTPPELAAVDLGPGSARLTLTDAGLLPPPFETDDDGGTWTLAADADLPLAPGEAGGRCAPFPVLASAAHSPDGRALLLDLEALGVAHITADPGAATGLLRHVAAELANARWSEDVEILLVGFGGELLPLNPERLRVLPDLAAGLTEIRAHVRRIEAALDTVGAASVVDGRLAEIAPDAWLPIVLLADGSAPVTDGDRDELSALAAELDDAGRRGVAIVVHGVAHVGTEIHIAGNGELVTRYAADGPWTAAFMTPSTATGLAGILAPTTEADLPVGPAEDPHTWAQDMDEDGAVSEPPTETDPEAERRLEIVERQDPTLDDDLARWHADGTPAVPLIGILGEPAVRAPGALPSGRATWVAEVLVYLALHPAGVTLQKVLADLWPDGRQVTLSTARHAVYTARRWAGRGLDGDPDRPFVSDMQSDTTYRLRGHLLDWDLFRRLRKRAQARHCAHHPGAVEDYRAAIGLVRGPVLSALRPDGYAWLAGHDQRHDLQIPGFLVDAAHELVDIALTDGDTALARWAAETARSVDTDAAFDRPLTDLMRVAHAEDHTSELERYATILLDARGFDVPEELPPETFAVLNALLPDGPRRTRTRP